MYRLFLSSLILLSTLSSCATSLPQRLLFRQAYQEGNFTQAEVVLTKRIGAEIPQNAYWRGRDAVCLLLDRGTTRFAANNAEGAIEDYALAIQALDYYGQDSTLDTAGQILLEDGCGAYQGSTIEHLLARVYFALALYHKGDTGNALALLRQAEDMQQNRSVSCNVAPKMNALAKYLLACLLEKQGDLSNAEILYKQVEQLSEGNLPYPQKKNKEQATILFICHNGNAPFKVSYTADASIISTAALEILLATHGIAPACSSLTGVPVPMYCQTPLSEPLTTLAEIDGYSSSFAPICDVAAAQYAELQQKLPLIAAKAAARLLIRRSAVAYAQSRDDVLGAIVDISMLLANLQTKADTRSWTTLPSRIDLAQFNTAPGCHSATITINGKGLPSYVRSIAIEVKAGDLCIINIFNIHPGVTTILVPSRFIPKEIIYEDTN